MYNFYWIPKFPGQSPLHLDEMGKVTGPSQDLEKLERWARANIKSNVDKCRVLHLKKNKQKHKYKMGENYPDGSTGEKDLEVLVDHRLIMSLQCDAAAKR